MSRLTDQQKEENNRLLHERFIIDAIEKKFIVRTEGVFLIDENNNLLTHATETSVLLIKESAERFFTHLEPRKRELMIAMTIHEVIRKGDII